MIFMFSVQIIPFHLEEIRKIYRGEKKHSCKRARRLSHEYANCDLERNDSILHIIYYIVLYSRDSLPIHYFSKFCF